jgi:hypothetical protein
VNPWLGGMADGLPGTVDIIFGHPIVLLSREKLKNFYLILFQ